MNNPGRKTLYYGTGDFAITTADTYTGEWLTALDGMVSATVQLKFSYGSGGTTARAYVQTTFDGTNPVDIACVLFTTADETVSINFDGTADAAQHVVTDGTMTDDTDISGFLGTSMRVKVISTGTYAGSTQIAVRATVR